MEELKTCIHYVSGGAAVLVPLAAADLKGVLLCEECFRLCTKLGAKPAEAFRNLFCMRAASIELQGGADRTFEQDQTGCVGFAR